MRCVLLTVCLLLLPMPSLAQTVPAPADAGRLERRFDRPPTAAAPRDRSPVAPLPQTAAPEGSERITFVLRRVDIDGVSAYTPDRLRALYADKIDTRVSLEDIYELARRITRLYNRDGYGFSLALVPAQQIGQGRVKLVVVEGYIARITPEQTNRANFIRRVFAPLLREKPLKSASLEQALLLLNTFPGARAKSVLKPVTGMPGALELVVVMEKPAPRVEITANNAGSRYTGPYQAGVSVLVPQILDTFSQLEARCIGAAPLKELQYCGAGYTVGLTSAGLRGSVDVGYAVSEPNDVLASGGLESTSLSTALTLTQPVLHSRRTSMDVSFSLGFKDIQSRFFSSVLYHDRIYALRWRGAYSWQEDGSASNYAQVEFSKGIQDFGASNPATSTLSRLAGRPDFYKIYANFQRMQYLSQDLRLSLQVQGQYAPTPLLSAEQFGFGGMALGRGYDASEIIGDHGAAAGVELEHTLPLMFHHSPLRAFGFYDIGFVDNKGTDNDSNSAASAGFGLRWQTERLSVSVLMAQPLTLTPQNPLYGDGKAPRWAFNFGLIF